MRPGKLMKDSRLSVIDCKMHVSRMRTKRLFQGARTLSFIVIRSPIYDLFNQNPFLAF